MRCTQGVGSVIEDTKRCIVLKSEQKAGSSTLPARTAYGLTVYVLSNLPVRNRSVRLH
jgi:hypothetical protein